MNHICKKCKGEITFANDMVCCPECGRTYHRWCWKSITNCIGCGAFNKEYAKELADRIAKNNFENGCEICKSTVFQNDAVKCPDCGKVYHRHCSLKVQNCNVCGCPTTEFVKTENIACGANVVQDSGMFSNIGEKIKTLATVVTIIGIIVGAIIFISMASIDEDMIFSGLLTGCAIALGSWIGSFALYGFGALISSTQNTERLTIELLKEVKNRD